MKRIGLWLGLALMAALLVWGLWRLSPRAVLAPVPEFVQAAAPVEPQGLPLPGPSPLDEHIVIYAHEQVSSVGSAFAVNRQGDWVTARHVVDDCKTVSIAMPEGAQVPVAEVRVDPESDLALLSTGRSPSGATLDLGSALQIGEPGFLTGYPQGAPGEVAVRLTGRAVLVTRGRREGQEMILAWAETDRTERLVGTLAGLSGGPVFDGEGAVRGVVVAESVRHGRIYTAAPESLAAFLTRLNVPMEAGEASAISQTSYRQEADAARRRLQVVKVICEVPS